jgi:hypothetical protein
MASKTLEPLPKCDTTCFKGKKGFEVTHFIQMKSKVFLVLSATLQPLEIKYPANLIHHQLDSRINKHKNR